MADAYGRRVVVEGKEGVEEEEEEKGSTKEKTKEEFSFRILLPKGEKLTNKAKKLGMTFQGEFILAIRKKGLVPQIRDLKYIHDEDHYGWILASPEVFEKFEALGREGKGERGAKSNQERFNKIDEDNDDNNNQNNINNNR
jgi:hypothetical protein